MSTDMSARYTHKLFEIFCTEILGEGADDAQSRAEWQEEYDSAIAEVGARLAPVITGAYEKGIIVPYEKDATCIRGEKPTDAAPSAVALKLKPQINEVYDATLRFILNTTDETAYEALVREIHGAVEE